MANRVKKHTGGVGVRYQRKKTTHPKTAEGNVTLPESLSILLLK